MCFEMRPQGRVTFEPCDPTIPLGTCTHLRPPAHSPPCSCAIHFEFRIPLSGPHHVVLPCDAVTRPVSVPMCLCAWQGASRSEDGATQVWACVCVCGVSSLRLDVLSTMPVSAQSGFSHTHPQRRGESPRCPCIVPQRVILSQCLSRSQCAMSDTFTPVYVCMCGWVSQCVCGCEVMNAAVYVCGSGKGWRKEVLPGRSVCGVCVCVGVWVSSSMLGSPHGDDGW